MKTSILLALVIALFVQSSQAFQVIDSDPENKLSRNPDYPAFGSGASSIRHYNLEASTIVPNQVITSTNEAIFNVTMGYGGKDDVRVKNIGDNIYALVAGITQDATFSACYDGFAVYALDLTGNGVDEILVEHGRGQGTCVYERFLSIYDNLAGYGLQLRHRIKLSEWHMDQKLNRPVAWVKGYSINRDESGKVVIRLEPLGVD